MGLLLKEVDALATADGDKAEGHIRDRLTEPDPWTRQAVCPRVQRANDTARPLSC